MGDSSESTPGAGATENVGGAGGGESLEDAARDERDVAAGRLRDELGHDPTDEEVNEWLRQHTEGY